MTDVTINTDGACTGNPGPGGFAAIIEWDPNGLITVSGGDPATTNNRMELAAVIEALRVLQTVPPLNAAAVTVRSDSQYVTRAFNDAWLDRWQQNGWRTANGKRVLNQDPWTDLLAETEELNIQWVWVRGHSGRPRLTATRRTRAAAGPADNRTPDWPADAPFSPARRSATQGVIPPCTAPTTTWDREDPPPLFEST